MSDTKNSMKFALIIELAQLDYINATIVNRVLLQKLF